MLVLARMPTEEIIIETPNKEIIRIKYLRSTSRQVFLGFEADKNISIHRKEIWERIQDEKSKNNNEVNT